DHYYQRRKDLKFNHLDSLSSELTTLVILHQKNLYKKRPLKRALPLPAQQAFSCFAARGCRLSILTELNLTETSNDLTKAPLNSNQETF
ncbi:MAG TPA: hypothetical protein VFR94_17910, partial [Nitrososphaeraceae archaeon]|nr:hypothetical protein [Nitrososphaeraceae archaeon]